MLTFPKIEDPAQDFPAMTRDELETKQCEAREYFDRALLQKIETDRIYVAAATRLNTLDRLVRKVQQRAAVDRRAAAKAHLRMAYAGAQA
jgi:hypothetical protein